MRVLILTIAEPGDDLLPLQQKSVKRYAQADQMVLRPRQTFPLTTPWPHAEGIEWARNQQLHRDYQVIILLDSDCLITSPNWLPFLTRGMDSGEVQAAGGYKHSGPIETQLVDGHWIIHASCLAMTNQAFSQCSSFYPFREPSSPWLYRDTAWRASLGLPTRLFPFKTIGTGSCFPGLPVGEYYDPQDSSIMETLWVHLLHGTNMRRRWWTLNRRIRRQEQTRKAWKEQAERLLVFQ